MIARKEKKEKEETYRVKDLLITNSSNTNGSLIV